MEVNGILQHYQNRCGQSLVDSAAINSLYMRLFRECHGNQLLHLNSSSRALLQVLLEWLLVVPRHLFVM
jgi:hypothetical protein